MSFHLILTLCLKHYPEIRFGITLSHVEPPGIKLNSVSVKVQNLFGTVICYVSVIEGGNCLILPVKTEVGLTAV